MKCLSVEVALNDDIAIFLRGLESSFVSHDIFVAHVGVLTERTRGCLNVLLRKSCRDIGRYQTVGFHLCRVKPNTHGVV